VPPTPVSDLPGCPQQRLLYITKPAEANSFPPPNNRLNRRERRERGAGFCLKNPRLLSALSAFSAVKAFLSPGGIGRPHGVAPTIMSPGNSSPTPHLAHPMVVPPFFRTSERGSGESPLSLSDILKCITSGGKNRSTGLRRYQVPIKQDQEVSKTMKTGGYPSYQNSKKRPWR